MTYSKKTISRKNGSQSANYNFKNIVVSVDGDTFVDEVITDRNGKPFRRFDNWFNISDNLLYLSYGGKKDEKSGRMYFFAGDKMIDLSCCDDEIQTINFKYKGEWEDWGTNEVKMIEIPVCVEFIEVRDYNKFKMLLEGKF
jgi:hypothetical protein